MNGRHRQVNGTPSRRTSKLLFYPERDKHLERKENIIPIEDSPLYSRPRSEGSLPLPLHETSNVRSIDPRQIIEWEGRYFSSMSTISLTYRIEEERRLGLGPRRGSVSRWGTLPLAYISWARSSYLSLPGRRFTGRRWSLDYTRLTRF